MKNWQNILEAFCSAPAIILEQTVNGLKEFLIEERELIQHGEFEEEEDVMVE